MKEPSVQSPASKQYTCVNCSCNLFYVMLQSSGDVEVFCKNHNHRQILVNITNLIKAAFDETFDKPAESELERADRNGDPSYNS